jgi:DNA polymerase II small subunit
LALQNEVFSALSYATSKGFQIHPDAFAMLKGLNTDVVAIIKEIIKVKKQSKNFVILVDDIKNQIGLKKAAEEGPAEQTCNILMDSTL